jgi:hypothetical protein
MACFEVPVITRFLGLGVIDKLSSFLEHSIDFCYFTITSLIQQYLSSSNREIQQNESPVTGLILC